MTREEIYGYSGSGIFCLLIFILLYLTVLKTTVKSGEEGILVQFGTVDSSSGLFNPRSGEPRNLTSNQETVQQTGQTSELPSVAQLKTQNNTTPLNTNTSANKSTSPPVITQNIENTAAIENARKEQEERNRIEAEQRAQRAKEQEDQRKRDAINQQITGAFGSNTSNSDISVPGGTGDGGAYGSNASGTNQGGTGTSGSGLQGNPNSKSSVGSPTGTGYGEFNLGGRILGAGGLPRPDYNVQEEGKIVINVTVDTKGNVIFTEIGKGTTIDNETLRKSALEAAKKAKFNSITGTNNQSGTITYKYQLR